jgi:hypothetical protein
MAHDVQQHAVVRRRAAAHGDACVRLEEMPTLNYSLQARQQATQQACAVVSRSLLVRQAVRISSWHAVPSAARWQSGNPAKPAESIKALTKRDCTSSGNQQFYGGTNVRATQVALDRRPPVRARAARQRARRVAAAYGSACERL